MACALPSGDWGQGPDVEFEDGHTHRSGQGRADKDTRLRSDGLAGASLGPVSSSVRRERAAPKPQVPTQLAGLSRPGGMTLDLGGDGASSIHWALTSPCPPAAMPTGYPNIHTRDKARDGCSWGPCALGVMCGPVSNKVSW